KRTSTNRRRFSQRDIRKLQAIQTLTRQHGVNLNGARYVLRLLRILVDNGLQAPAELRELDVKELDVEAESPRPERRFAATGSARHTRETSLQRCDGRNVVFDCAR